MRGVITHRDVLQNLALVWREFGTACVMRWVISWVTRRPTTFLNVAYGRR